MGKGYLVKCLGAGLMIASAFGYRNSDKPLEYCLFWVIVGALIAFYGLALEDGETRLGPWMNPDSYYLKKKPGFRYFAKWRLIVILGVPVGWVIWTVYPVLIPLLQNYAEVVLAGGGP